MGMICGGCASVADTLYFLGYLCNLSWTESRILLLGYACNSPDFSCCNQSIPPVLPAAIQHEGCAQAIPWRAVLSPGDLIRTVLLPHHGLTTPIAFLDNELKPLRAEALLDPDEGFAGDPLLPAAAELEVHLNDVPLRFLGVPVSTSLSPTTLFECLNSKLTLAISTLQYLPRRFLANRHSAAHPSHISFLGPGQLGLGPTTISLYDRLRRTGTRVPSVLATSTLATPPDVGGPGFLSLDDFWTLCSIRAFARLQGHKNPLTRAALMALSARHSPRLPPAAHLILHSDSARSGHPAQYRNERLRARRKDRICCGGLPLRRAASPWPPGPASRFS